MLPNAEIRSGEFVNSKLAWEYKMIIFEFRKLILELLEFINDDVFCRISQIQVISGDVIDGSAFSFI
jgi:hypothetical protein